MEYVMYNVMQGNKIVNKNNSSELPEEKLEEMGL